MDLSGLSDRERLVVEQALTTYRALERAALDAPHGRGLAALEEVVHDRGFEYLRTMMAVAASARPEAQKRGACVRPCACGGKAKFKRLIGRTVLTSIGHVTLVRRYYACPSCPAKQTPFDGWAGLAGSRRSLTEHARRMVSLAGMSWSFDTAAKRLAELCHVRVSDDTIERVCQEEGRAARAWMGESDEPVRAFAAAAAGQAEFYTDGLKANTVGGWREMRLSVFAKREPGPPCGPDDWARRVLEEPTVRLAGCAIAPSNVIGASWQRTAKRLGLSSSSSSSCRLSVLGDGARWIWDEASKRFTCPAEWCLDVFHVSQHLHDCGKALLGEGPAARAWADERRAHLLSCDGVGLIGRLEAERDAGRDGEAGAAGRAAVGRLLGYLAENRDSMWYRGRLARGLPIGSGLVEGACKNAIHARPRLNNARWRIRRAERTGALRCLDYSGRWDAYWAPRAA